MAKCFGPCFSIECQGQVGKGLIFTGSISPQVRGYYFTSPRSMNAGFRAQSRRMSAKSRLFGKNRWGHIVDLTMGA